MDAGTVVAFALVIFLVAWLVLMFVWLIGGGHDDG